MKTARCRTVLSYLLSKKERIRIHIHISFDIHKLLKDTQRINTSDYLLGIRGKRGNWVAERWVKKTLSLKPGEYSTYFKSVYVRKRKEKENM